jgi:hypothetical protein
MKMASSIISDLRTFVRRDLFFLESVPRDFLSGINGDVKRLKFSRYRPSYLASLDQYWIRSNGYYEEVCPCNICPGYYIVDNGDSYFRLSSDIDQAIWLLFPGILMLLLTIVTEYFNGSIQDWVVKEERI